MADPTQGRSYDEWAHLRQLLGAAEVYEWACGVPRNAPWRYTRTHSNGWRIYQPTDQESERAVASQMVEDDAALAVAARNALPALLAELSGVRVELDQAREENERLHAASWLDGADPVQLSESLRQIAAERDDWRDVAGLHTKLAESLRVERDRLQQRIEAVEALCDRWATSEDVIAERSASRVLRRTLAAVPAGQENSTEMCDHGQAAPHPIESGAELGVNSTLDCPGPAAAGQENPAPAKCDHGLVGAACVSTFNGSAEHCPGPAAAGTPLTGVQFYDADDEEPLVFVDDDPAAPPTTEER